MKCDKCGAHMTHMDVHKNDELKKENAELRAKIKYLEKELAIAQGYMRKMLDIAVTMPEYNFKEYRK